MSIIGLCGFGGKSLGYDNITLISGNFLWNSTPVPNSSTSGVLRASSSTTPGFGRIPWEGAATDEFWLHAHFFKNANNARNDQLRIGWANGSTDLGWVSLQDTTLEWQIIIDGTVEATSSGEAASIQTWYSVLVHVVMATPTGGSVDVYIDGDLATAVVSFSGDTDPNSDTNADAFYFGVSENSSYIANLVAMDPTDATGITDENQLLNVGITNVAPDADVNYTAWSPDTGGTGYTQIDEAPASDSDYVQATATSQRATFSMASVGSPAVVLAAKWCSRMTRTGTDAGANVSVTRRLSSTDYDETAVAAPGAGYVYELWDQKPGGGNWTATDIDNTEFGVLSVT